MRVSAIAVLIALSVALLRPDVGLAQGKQRYNESIKAPVFLFAPGQPFAAFMSEAQGLRLKVDGARR